jgi:CBS domain-containing protein
MDNNDFISKGVRGCQPEDTLSKAAGVMREHDCGCLLVTTGNESDRVAGLLTDRDISMAAYFHGKDLNSLKVSQAMSTEIAGWGLYDAVVFAETVMINNEMHPLALMDEQGSLIGVISPYRT